MQEGQYVQVQCLAAEGDLPMEILWYFNGKNVKTYSEINVAKMGQRSSILSVETVSHLIAGNFTCKATNQAGTSSYTTELQVNGYLINVHSFCSCFSRSFVPSKRKLDVKLMTQDALCFLSLCRFNIDKQHFSC